MMTPLGGGPLMEGSFHQLVRGGSHPVDWWSPVLVLFLPQWHYLRIGRDAHLRFARTA